MVDRLDLLLDLLAILEPIGEKVDEWRRQRKLRKAITSGSPLEDEYVSISPIMLVRSSEDGQNRAARKNRERVRLEGYKAALEYHRTGESLRGADLSRSDLTGRQLSKADLRAANLMSADLSGANLEGADLSSARLDGANLQGAILKEAILDRADLQSAKLRESNLRGATLWRANLYQADLRGADLQGADLLQANLEGATLDDSTSMPEGWEEIAASKP